MFKTKRRITSDQLHATVETQKQHKYMNFCCIHLGNLSDNMQFILLYYTSSGETFGKKRKNEWV